MRILIDLRWMVPGYTGGIEIHTRAFLNTLLQIDYLNTYDLLLPTAIRYDFNLTGHTNFHLWMCDGPAYYWRRLWNHYSGLDRQLSNSSIPPGLLDKIDVVLSLSGIISKDLLDKPNVLIVPDIQHEYLPENFSYQELVNRRRTFTQSIQSAHIICAISNFTSQTLIEKLGVPSERIRVTPLAADPIFTSAANSDKDEAILDKYQLLERNYFFYPAATWLHKNHRLIIEAFNILRRSGKQTPFLVCSGARKEAYPALCEQIASEDLTKNIKFLDYIPFEDLPALYRSAEALIFPSFFEGFGMPLLEAMASGCPVISSNATSLKEIGGEAPLYFNPTSPDELINSILRVQNESDLRRSMIEKGYKRATEFSWIDYTTQVWKALADTVMAYNGIVEPIKESNFKPSGLYAFNRQYLARCHIRRLQEYYRQKNFATTFSNSLLAFLLGPDVVFYLVFYPDLRLFFSRLKNRR